MMLVGLRARQAELRNMSDLKTIIIDGAEVSVDPAMT
ncbi:MAG: hypothetical protein ACJAXU_002459, partial [Paracoccaceae bacterium]